jgi:hypothetical protein
MTAGTGTARTALRAMALALGLLTVGCRNSEQIRDIALAKPPERLTAPEQPAPASEASATTPAEAPAILPNDALTFTTALGVALTRNPGYARSAAAVDRAKINVDTTAAGYSYDWLGRLIANAQPPLESGNAANHVGAYYDVTGHIPPFPGERLAAGWKTPLGLKMGLNRRTKRTLRCV